MAVATNAQTGSSIHKYRRPFDSPVALPKPHPRFIPPPLTNLQNLVLPLHAVDAALSTRITAAGRLVVHFLGDTGGIYGTEVQESVAHAMEAQFTQDTPGNNPAFFYHLGDVIYFNGQSELYPTQFYEPYQYYPANIFAIPGNHDGDNKTRPGDAPDSEPSLFGFTQNFCDSQRRYLSSYRPTMTQPYVYWTLDAPLVTIIGLYSNVDGLLDGRGTYEQTHWLETQLSQASPDKWLLIAVHHPPYSLDSAHGGCPDIGAAIDDATKSAKRFPDMVLSGHVHNYQRFTRKRDGRSTPYVVAGAGGYANTPKAMHKLQRGPDGKPPAKGKPTLDKEVTFENYDESNPGFLRLTFGDKKLVGEYFSVPFDGSPPAKPMDTFHVP